MDKWTNILVHHWWCLCRQGVCLNQLQFHWLINNHGIVAWFCLHFCCIRQLIEQCILLEGTRQWDSSQLYCLDWAWRRPCDLLGSCTFGSFIPCFASYGIFQSPSGEWFYYLCDTLRGEPSISAEPVEDFFILFCPFIPFGTCGWGSQPHTAIIAVW